MAKWLDNAIFYEIYPQSFLDTNGDGIGDFQGIIEKLDYIKELGCNAIWMNPCFASPFGDAGYDVADYYQAAPRYGTNADLKRLFNEVHKRNMHILLDLVPGHTSVHIPGLRSPVRQIAMNLLIVISGPTAPGDSWKTWEVCAVSPRERLSDRELFRTPAGTQLRIL